MTDRLLRVSTIAKRLDCSREHIYHLIRTGELRAQWIGRRSVRVKEQDLFSYLKRILLDGARE